MKMNLYNNYPKAKEHNLKLQEKEKELQNLESNIFKRFKKTDTNKENKESKDKQLVKNLVSTEISSSTPSSFYNTSIINTGLDKSKKRSNPSSSNNLPIINEDKIVKRITNKTNTTKLTNTSNISNTLKNIGNVDEILKALKQEVINKIAKNKNIAYANNNNNHNNTNRHNSDKKDKASLNLKNLLVHKIHLQDDDDKITNTNNMSNRNSNRNTINIDENFELNDSNNIIEISKEDLKLYGNREPNNYKRIKLLGK